MFYCQKCGKKRDIFYPTTLTLHTCNIYTGDSNISNISIRLQNKTNGTWRDNSVLSTC